MGAGDTRARWFRPAPAIGPPRWLYTGRRSDLANTKVLRPAGQGRSRSKASGAVGATISSKKTPPRSDPGNAQKGLAPVVAWLFCDGVLESGFRCLNCCQTVL